MNILEQQGGLTVALGYIFSIFFGIINYKVHEITILNMYEAFENR